MKTNLKTLIVILASAAAAGSHASQFRVTITNTGPQPLSPLFVATGNDQFNIFSIGAPASLGIKRVAEMGDASELVNVAAASPAVAWYGVLGDSPLAPGAMRSFVIQADEAHPYFSFAAMLGKTNDGFIGESVNSMGINLFGRGRRKGLYLVVDGERAWDAGTEANTQSAVDLGFAGGFANPSEESVDAHIRVHTGVSAGIGDSWSFMPNWTQSTALAKIVVTPL